MLLVIITIMLERVTSQRELILNYLKNTKSHPSADTVYQEVRKILPRISLGTVYRNLEYLKNKGQIVELKGKVKRYDADLSDHHHFICDQCQNIFDIYDKFEIKTEFGKIGKVKKYHLYLHGSCNDCLNK